MALLVVKRGRWNLHSVDRVLRPIVVPYFQSFRDEPKRRF